MLRGAIEMRAGSIMISSSQGSEQVQRCRSYVPKKYDLYDSDWTGVNLYENNAINSLYTSPNNLNRARFSSQYDPFDGLLKALSVCPATSNDALVVFWSGHGEYVGDEHYLVAANGKKIARKKVLQAMKARGARLTVLLTDCCASEYDPSNNLALNLGSFEVAPVTAETTPLFDELFLRYRGVVDVNSSSKGQKAFSFPRRLSGPQIAAGSYKGNRGGGCFTLALADEHQWKDMKFKTKDLPQVVLRETKREFDASNFYNDLNYGNIGRLLNDGYRVSWKEFIESVQVRTQFLYEHSPAYSPSQSRQTLQIWELPVRMDDQNFNYQ